MRHSASMSLLICIYASIDYTIIGSDKACHLCGGQAIVWTNAGILLIEP